MVILGLGLTFSIIEGFISYRAGINRLEHTLGQIRESHIPFLISSLWLTDYSLVQAQVESIVRFTYVDRVEVANDEGEVFSAGRDDIYGLERQREALLYSYKDEQVPIGTLTVFVNRTALRSDVLKESAISVVFHGSLAVLIAILVTAMFRLMIGRHLVRAAEFLTTDRPETISSPLVLDRRKNSDTKRGPDELDRLVDALNEMRRNQKLLLDRKEMVLREVHHRVKNNLHTVASLLYLQIENGTSPEARHVLEDARTRLQSMALLYDKLYATGASIEMSSQEYFPNLIDEIVSVFPGRSQITTRVQVEDLKMPVDMVSSLGIIINELITNSMKHAFTVRSSGIIEVTVRTVAENRAGPPLS